MRVIQCAVMAIILIMIMPFMALPPPFFADGVPRVNLAEGVLVQSQQSVQRDPVPTHQPRREVQEQGRGTVGASMDFIGQAQAQSIMV